MKLVLEHCLEEVELTHPHLHNVCHRTSMVLLLVVMEVCSLQLDKPPNVPFDEVVSTFLLDPKLHFNIETWSFISY